MGIPPGAPTTLAQDGCIRLGIQVSYFSWSDAPASIEPAFGRIARNAEAAGPASLWVMDHFFQIHANGPPEPDMVEGCTALAFAAGQTSRIEFGRGLV